MGFVVDNSNCFCVIIFLMYKTIAAIIPVYNEERTVGHVVQQVVNSALFDEIICVNDGSTDKSQKILEGFLPKIKLINFKKNQGKGAGLAAGVENCHSEIVVFLDSDLIKIDKRHFQTLINPLLQGQAKAVLLGRDDLLDLNKYTGERAYFRTDLLPLIAKMKPTGYGVETLLNLYCKKKKMKVLIIQSDHEQLIKPQKYGFKTKMIKGYGQMVKDITRTLAQEKGLSREKAKELQEKIKKYILAKYLQLVKPLKSPPFLI